jgi:hypothetical protein
MKVYLQPVLDSWTPFFHTHFSYFIFRCLIGGFYYAKNIICCQFAKYKLEEVYCTSRGEPMRQAVIDVSV